MIFLTLLQGHMPEPDILLLAAAFRLITFGGDVMVLLIGLLLRGGLNVSVHAENQGGG